MPLPSQQLYQGRDWVTSRLSVAALYETLEEIHDLCLSYQDINEEDEHEAFDILTEIHNQVETLTSQYAIALADMIRPHDVIGSPNLVWRGFEANWIMQEIKNKLFNLSGEEDPSTGAGLALLTKEMKACFKRIDL